MDYSNGQLGAMLTVFQAPCPLWTSCQKNPGAAGRRGWRAAPLSAQIAHRGKAGDAAGQRAEQVKRAMDQRRSIVSPLQQQHGFAGKGGKGGQAAQETRDGKQAPFRAELGVAGEKRQRHADQVAADRPQRSQAPKAAPKPTASQPPTWF